MFCIVRYWHVRNISLGFDTMYLDKAINFPIKGSTNFTPYHFFLALYQPTQKSNVFFFHLKLNVDDFDF